MPRNRTHSEQGFEEGMEEVIVKYTFGWIDLLQPFMKSIGL